MFDLWPWRGITICVVSHFAVLLCFIVAVYDAASLPNCLPTFRNNALILSATENVVLNIVASFCHYPYCEFLVRLMWKSIMFKTRNCVHCCGQYVYQALHLFYITYLIFKRFFSYTFLLDRLFILQSLQKDTSNPSHIEIVWLIQLVSIPAMTWHLQNWQQRGRSSVFSWQCAKCTQQNAVG